MIQEKYFLDIDRLNKFIKDNNITKERIISINTISVGLIYLYFYRS